MKKIKRAAVITDCVSAGFFFPLWHSYYGKAVDDYNLFVCTHRGKRPEFDAYRLGGIWETDTFDNNLRIHTISKLISALLMEYDYVIRVDTDEFIIPDPRYFKSLREYVESLDQPYVTTMGYDIIQGENDEPLDLARPVIGLQRNYAYPFDALNKTAIVRNETRWAPGFHFANVYPSFYRCYLLHMKKADIDIQVEIGKAVAENGPNDNLKSYHLVSRENVLASVSAARNFPLYRGWEHFERQSYNEGFLRNIAFTENFGGIYHGAQFRPEQVLLEIPDEFAGAF